MERVSVRQLRNDVSRILARVKAGERLVVTSDGVPVAEIGPPVSRPEEQTLEALIAAGRVIPPRTRSEPAPARPIEFDGPHSTEEILDELRRDRM